MRRYLRLYLHFIRFSFSTALVFRVDFLFRFFMDALWYGILLAFFHLLFRHTSTLGGWTESQTTVFAGALFVADALHMTIFSTNMYWLPILVNRGDLDGYLVRPVSSLFFLSVRLFAANSFLNLLLASLLYAYLLSQNASAWAPARLPLHLALLLLGLFLHYVLQLLFVIPVFWMHNAAGLQELWFSLSTYTHRPDVIFTGFIRRLLTTLLPLALIVSFPVRVLFAANPWPIALHMLVAAVLLFGVVLWLWRRGLRAYVSASS